MIYLAYFEAPETDAGWLADQYDGFALSDRLILVETGATRSRLYHSIKKALPDGAPLLVARLDDEAKLKGMAPGALKWLRARTRG